jgi:hypothetical protein
MDKHIESAILNLDIEDTPLLNTDGCFLLDPDGKVLLLPDSPEAEPAATK